MRLVRAVVLGFFCLAARLLAPASAAVLIPVPAAPNSTITTAFAINDNYVIAGSYVGANDGIEHSFGARRGANALPVEPPSPRRFISWRDDSPCGREASPVAHGDPMPAHAQKKRLVPRVGEIRGLVLSIG